MKMSRWLSAVGVVVFATMVAGCAGEVDPDDYDDTEVLDDADDLGELDSVESEGSAPKGRLIVNPKKGAEYTIKAG